MCTGAMANVWVLYASWDEVSNLKHHTDNYKKEGLCLSLTQNKQQTNKLYTFSSVQSLSHVWCFVTPWTAACQSSLSITSSQGLLKLMSIEVVMPSNHLILYRPLFLQSLPASGSFPVSQFFTSGVQIIGASASASVLPMNI